MARFFRRGKTRFYFLATAPAVLTAPTTTELSAGSRLDPQIGEVAGFSFANQPIETPDMANAFVSKIAGPDSSEDSSLTFYDDKTATPNLRTVLAKGTLGYIVILPHGGSGAAGIPAATDKCEVWPVEVAGIPRIYSTGNDAAMWRADISINGQPTIDGALT